MKPVAIVLGGGGFVGRHTCRALSERGFEVRALGHGTWERDIWAGWGISQWIPSDISDNSLREAAGSAPVTLFIHCAGSGAVSLSYSHPGEDFDRSVNTTAVVLDYLRRFASDARLVIASSAAVYGDHGDVDLTESDICAPMSPYGVHKLIAENLAQSYSLHFGVKVSIIRLFSVYGEGLEKQLLWDAMKKFRDSGAKFFGTGNELRDWIHVEDAARLLCHVGLASQSSYEIYNGGASKVSVRHVLEALARAAGNPAQIIFNGETHVGNPRRLTADSSHVARQLHWKAQIPLADGLRRYADWFKGLRA